MLPSDPRRRRIGIVFLALALVLSAAPAHAAPVRQQAGGEYTVGDCSRIDRTQLRNEIEAHVLAVLQNDVTSFDVDAIVDRAWADLQMDAVVDAEVARAVDDILNNEDYLNRLISGWWGEKAQEYAERVANDAFGSPTFRVRLDELSATIGTEVARQVEAQFAQAASVALLCLQAYVGEYYSDSFFSLFAERVQAETETLHLDPLAAPEVGALMNHPLALAGVGTILATQLVSRLSQKLGQRIAQRVAGKVVGRILGKAGSSFIPIAGWIIGIGMIVYDLWEGGQGALPQIKEGLQSPEVKQKIRAEIADAVKDDLPEQASLIALETAVSLTEQWQGFCGTYEYVCLVAEQNDGFRRMLQEVPLDELGSVAALVNFYMRELGRTELDRALADGSLTRLLVMPDAALTLLSETHSTVTTLAWSDLAAGRLDLVVNWGIHRQAQPADFTPTTFDALLALGDAALAQKVLALPVDKRTALLGLPSDVLARLVAVEPIADLDWLAGYLLLPGQQPQVLAKEVVEGKITVAELRGPATRAAATATQASVAAAPVPVSMEATPVAGSAEPSRHLPTVLIILLLLAGAAGTGGALWRRRWQR